MPQKPEENYMTDKKIAIQYQLFRWGPCLVKLSISKENQDLLLKEAKASRTDFETRLAGIVTKQVAFRNYTMFEELFSKIFELYADALEKWTGDNSIDFKQKYELDALWANFQRPGDFNPPHDHGGTLSWVIFLDVPEALIEENKKYKGRSAGPGGITFIYGDGPRESVTHHSFVPKSGDMYIFPAWLKHWVYPFKSNCTRISVSGNVRDYIKIKDVRGLKPVTKEEVMKKVKEPALKGNN